MENKNKNQNFTKLSRQCPGCTNWEAPGNSRPGALVGHWSWAVCPLHVWGFLGCCPRIPTLYSGTNIFCNYCYISLIYYDFMQPCKIIGFSSVPRIEYTMKSQNLLTVCSKVLFFARACLPQHRPKPSFFSLQLSYDVPTRLKWWWLWTGLLHGHSRE